MSCKYFLSSLPNLDFSTSFVSPTILLTHSCIACTQKCAGSMTATGDRHICLVGRLEWSIDISMHSTISMECLLGRDCRVCKNPLETPDNHKRTNAERKEFRPKYESEMDFLVLSSARILFRQGPLALHARRYKPRQPTLA